MSHQSPVGIDPGMPDKQYKLALMELWDRYRYLIFYKLNSFFFTPVAETKQQKETEAKKDEIKQTVPEPAVKDSIKHIELNDAGIRKPGIGFNPGYEQLYNMARADSIPFFIYLHPEISEIELGHFNDQGEEIIRFAKANHIRLINEFDLGIILKYYREMDVIHYNNSGQLFLANNLYPLFSDYLKNIH